MTLLGGPSSRMPPSAAKTYSASRQIPNLQSLPSSTSCAKYISVMESCCTCASILPSTSSSHIDKALSERRILECCGRIICGKCISVRRLATLIASIPPQSDLVSDILSQNNPRFAEYCPYCQVSIVPSSLPQRLKDPPSYSSVPATSSKTTELSDAPPPYTLQASAVQPPVDDEKAALLAGERHAEDTLHFLNHELDSINSLSLRYGVPAAALRRANNINSDHLLNGRRTVIIPGEFYKGGVSLSPRPVEGEEEELRKNKIRRFMTSCKVSDYDIALLYLEQSHYDLEDATLAFVDDEAWERDHPQEARKNGKGVVKGRGHKNPGTFRRGP